MNQTFVRMQIADYGELPVGIGQVYEIEGKELVIFKLTKGEVYALENQSPNPRGGTLADGMVSGSYVFCPISDWKISLVDGRVQAPDQGEVKTYSVEIEEGHVFIWI